MRLTRISTIATLMVGLTIPPAYSAPKGGQTAHGPSVKASPKSSVTKTTKVAHTPKAPKTTTAHVTKVSKTTAAPKTSKAAKVAKTSTNTKTSASTSTSPTTTATTPNTIPVVDFTTSPVGQKLAKNTALRTKLESRLTALGYTGTVYQAAYGFKNQGQFVAATNVSRNLGASFEQLKLQMTGLSVKPDGTVLRANLGPDGKITMVDPQDVTQPAPTKSLGQAIQTVKSGVDANSAANTATTQADAEILTTTMASR